MMCADSVTGSTPTDHVGRGGSIPASALFFHIGKTVEAESLVHKYHYSRRVPASVQFVGTLHTVGGLFGSCGDAVAAAFFSIPPTRWSEPVLELSRLVRVDGTRPPLTMLISKCCKALARKGFDLIVSFADQQQGHVGTVYQAAGWNYNGQRNSRMDGVMVDGVFVPGRSCNSTWGTQSPDKLRSIVKADIEAHYDEGKHLYWKALSRSGMEKASRLGLESRPYPKIPLDTEAER
jgi:hypothetical protein